MQSVPLLQYSDNVKAAAAWYSRHLNDTTLSPFLPRICSDFHLTRDEGVEAMRIGKLWWFAAQKAKGGRGDER